MWFDGKSKIATYTDDELNAADNAARVDPEGMGSTGEYSSNTARYQRLKQSLAMEKIKNTQEYINDPGFRELVDMIFDEDAYDNGNTKEEVQVLLDYLEEGIVIQVKGDDENNNDSILTKIYDTFISIDNWLSDIERKQYEDRYNRAKETFKMIEELQKANPDNPFIPYNFVSENDPNYEEAIREAVEFSIRLERMSYISCGGLSLDLTSLSQVMSSPEIAKRIVNAERVGSGLKSDIYHRAASYLTEEQLSKGKVFNLDNNKILLQVEGSVNGKEGVFEYILDELGRVTHQLFKEGGMINGIPN